MWIVIAATIAIGLALVVWRTRATRRTRPLLIASATWALFAACEWWVENIFDPTGHYIIRADGVVIIFWCFVITIACIVWSIVRRG